jgi:hypothetical protein
MRGPKLFPSMVYKIDLSTQKSRCAIVELLKAVSIMPIDHKV